MIIEGRSLGVSLVAVLAAMFGACSGRSLAPGDGSASGGEGGAAGGAASRAGASGAVQVAGALQAGAGAGGGASSEAGAGGSSGASVEVGAAGAADAGDAGAGSLPKGCFTTLDATDALGKLAVRNVHVSVNGVYLAAGEYAASSGQFDYEFRPYAVQVPKSYDHTQPYRVQVQIGACGTPAAAFAEHPSALSGVDPKLDSIDVVLAPIDTCFRDGGPAIGNRADSPDIAYFHAVLADLKSNFCIDPEQVFVSGRGSGAWLTETLGCAAADEIRGFSTLQGGLRAVRPQCSGPVPALLVAPTKDITAPLGPLDPSDPRYVSLGGPGAIPGRDELLQRNGCTGTATQAWDARYPGCVAYTDCPAAFPVVWCAIEASAQVPGFANGVSYFPGPATQFFDSLR